MGLSELASFLGWWLFYIPLHSFSALVVTIVINMTGFLGAVVPRRFDTGHTAVRWRLHGRYIAVTSR